ncbi:MAG: ABC transporter substrate-binding protein, partial [Thermodesulfobacteriota bacterium]|nr:ABC transporter substrate-binding protein [Thermodesulfobacteriota bacterium]
MRKALVCKDTTSLTIGSILFLCMVFLWSADGHCESARGVTDDTIKVGAVIAMTGPGAGTLFPYQEAFKNYFRYVNEQGGIHGRKVKLIVEDDRFTIPASIAAYKKLLYKDSVLAI